MTEKEKLERELEDARRQCESLLEEYPITYAALVNQFRRLDAAEQAEKAAGKKGGRPPDATPSPAALAKRRQRAAKKAGSKHSTPSKKKGRE